MVGERSSSRARSSTSSRAMFWAAVSGPGSSRRQTGSAPAAPTAAHVARLLARSDRRSVLGRRQQGRELGRSRSGPRRISSNHPSPYGSSPTTRSDSAEPRVDPVHDPAEGSEQHPRPLARLERAALGAAHHGRPHRRRIEVEDVADGSLPVVGQADGHHRALGGRAHAWSTAAARSRRGPPAAPSSRSRRSADPREQPIVHAVISSRTVTSRTASSTYTPSATLTRRRALRRPGAASHSGEVNRSRAPRPPPPATPGRGRGDRGRPTRRRTRARTPRPGDRRRRRGRSDRAATRP